ncbi:hypothetical protein NHQ30_010852 [Ciborinia camelliae]|nr:hypothetical protein NHQ30_010852 [Ciborinia camelliae]
MSQLERVLRLLPTEPELLDDEQKILRKIKEIDKYVENAQKIKDQGALKSSKFSKSMQDCIEEWLRQLNGWTNELHECLKKVQALITTRRRFERDGWRSD